MSVWVCMYNVCSYASSCAISQAQSLKLFSEKTKIKGETSTIPSLWFSFSPLSPLIFLILHLFSILHQSPSSLSFSIAPFPFPSFAFPSSSPSLYAPAIKYPPSPSCTPWQQQKTSSEEETDRYWHRAPQSVWVWEYTTVCGDVKPMAGLIWPAMCRPIYMPLPPVAWRNRHTPHCRTGFNEGYPSVCVLLSVILTPIFGLFCVFRKEGLIFCLLMTSLHKICTYVSIWWCLRTHASVNVRTHSAMDRYFNLCIFLRVIKLRFILFCNAMFPPVLCTCNHAHMPFYLCLYMFKAMQEFIPTDQGSKRLF